MADHRGDVVVVNVWGSWCPPCIAEAPALEKVWEQTRSEGVQFVGVEHPGPERRGPRARAPVRDHLPEHRRRRRPGAAAFRGTLPPVAIPSTLVLDRSGRVAARVLGKVGARHPARRRGRRPRRAGPVSVAMSSTDTITDGSLLLAVPLAGLAGLVSFLSPCVLPLVPGYLSYVTGMTGVRPRRAPSRAAAWPARCCSSLGFTVVFVTRRRPGRRVRGRSSSSTSGCCSASSAC